MYKAKMWKLKDNIEVGKIISIMILGLVQILTIILPIVIGLVVML